LTPFDSLFSELGRLFANDDWRLSAGAYQFGDAELKTEEDGYALSVKLPGIKDDDVKLTVTADQIQLRGERKVDVPEGFRARHRERQSYTFERTYRLPTAIDATRVEARLSNGLLTVTLPKAEASKPRAISVRPA
jgi:HSP20 family protein